MSLYDAVMIIRYLKEQKPHGSAGGLFHFRDMIMEDNPVFDLIFSCPCLSLSSSPIRSYSNAFFVWIVISLLL